MCAAEVEDLLRVVVLGMVKMSNGNDCGDLLRGFESFGCREVFTGILNAGYWW